MLEICKKREKTLKLALAAQLFWLSWMHSQDVAWPDSTGSDANGELEVKNNAFEIAARLSIYENMHGQTWEDSQADVRACLVGFPDGDEISQKIQKSEATLMGCILSDPALEGDVTKKFKAIPPEYQKFLE